MSEPMKAYEVVDATDNDRYQTLGLFLSLDQALAGIHEATDPNDFGCNDGEGFFRVEIRERALGWDDNWITVGTFEWTQVYDEAADEYVWKKREVTP